MKNAIKNYLTEHDSFSSSEFAEMLREDAPGTDRSTVYYHLNRLCESGAINRTGRGQFSVSGKTKYYYELSETAKEIAAAIQKRFPLVDFQVWELSQLNEFVNHQLSRNIIFVDVEKPLDESIFNLLFEKYPHVLHNASLNEYYKYSGRETIIVRKLISEAPSGSGEYKQASLEKILVDLFGHGIACAVISRSEYPAIYEEAFNKYIINQSKLFRYARRRGIEADILGFIRERTNIGLKEIR